ncbi:spore coat protein A [Marininema mesophilum]|uniref:Spore coat protein A n=1 Tax=Marininema mesophilum TaxID=1048340 RepID=A0A1H2ZLS0_9BACL|nr:multicopper oxidase [Marininema mesophilum]SDX18452.1 spore coat protein A [Marininema mesophilum]
MFLQKYVDPLPILPTLQPYSIRSGIPYYILRMKQVNQHLHRDLNKTPVWGFEGMYPGPTIEVWENQIIDVYWKNELPLRHLFPVDTTIHGAGEDVPQVRTVSHLHGGHTPPDSDGHPDAWFTRDFTITGPRFRNQIYRYPNPQRPTTLWYHDHTMGITRINNYAGLSGFYLIRGIEEERLPLPKGCYEIPLLIQDRSFQPDGSLYYPSGPKPHKKDLPCPSIVDEFFGDTNLVNGKVWPYCEVEPRKYRFRILNAANARFYNLKLGSGLKWIQIGTDGGLLEAPVQLSSLLLSPAERADVIIDFSKLQGHTITMTNDAPAPFPAGNPVDPDTTGQVMQFRVNQSLNGVDDSMIPLSFAPLSLPNPTAASYTRRLTLDDEMDRYGRMLMLLNKHRYDDPPTETPQWGDTEIWELINLTPKTHPIHLHLIQFRLLDRRSFDVERFMQRGRLIFTSPPRVPERNELGWKDTIRANPKEVTRIVVRFVPYTGNYIWHCHILEHEDHEMMRPLVVVDRHSQ